MSVAGRNVEIWNPDHPKLGNTIKFEPIQTVNASKNLNQYLVPSPRDFALFVVDINTAYRAPEPFAHTSQEQTLAYLCIQDEEVESIYAALEL